ncbi:MAG TPA: arsenate reductase ArsC [Candidatus Dormibacteraeota bacterium]|nr:arsenate reductase ArsC [Candidatus Dormibacteraeota bacterium]
MARVLFVCLHNAGRSQMSQAFFEKLAADHHEAWSAGTEPAANIDPNVVTAMKEVGIDLGHRVPRRLTNDQVRWADLVVTMGCGDACPVFPGKTYIDWDLLDPGSRSLDEVRKIRDDIEGRIKELVKELDHATIGG